MSDFARKFTWATVPSFLVAILVEVLPISLLAAENSGANSIYPAILNFPGGRIMTLTAVLALPSYLVMSYLVDVTKSLVGRRREIRKSNSPVVSSTDRKPSRVYWNGSIGKFGVLWAVGMGTHRRASAPFAYVERNPRCPTCLTEMHHRSTPKWVVFKNEIWKCGNCGKTVERPKDVLYKEQETVENICMKEIPYAIDEGVKNTSMI